MIAGVICHVLDGREALSVRISCFCHKLLCLGKISLEIVCVEELPVLGNCCVSEGRAWLCVRNTWAYKVRSRRVGSLHDSICNILTVKGKA